MDDQSQNVATFLEAIQDAMTRLGQIYSNYRARGLKSRPPSLTLSGRPFRIGSREGIRSSGGAISLGFYIQGADGFYYILGVDVLWDENGWTIRTEAERESDYDEDTILLRELPPRVAMDLTGCIRELHAAIEDLLTFDDLVPFEREEG